MRSVTILFVHSNGWAGRLIRLAARLRFRGPDRPYAYWNHVALLFEEDVVIEATARGVTESRYANWVKLYPNHRLKVCWVNPVDEAEMRDFARSQVGRRYGWLTILSIGLGRLTGGKFAFGLDGTDICSGLVARTFERGHAIYDDPIDVEPADLARQYGVKP